MHRTCAMTLALAAGFAFAAAPAQACEQVPARSQVSLSNPLDVPITSGFGMRLHPLLNEQRMHTGWDYGAPDGTPVGAAAPGRVVSAERQGYFGLLVVVAHGGGVETAYAHLRRMSVAAGDCLAAGDRVGEVGSTGLTASNQLHFEVRLDGTAVDPSSWLAVKHP